MYEIICEECGEIGFHPSRVAAESKGETHHNETEHGVSIVTME